MTENLLENYEINYLNFDHMSIDYAIKNEYPIISLFTPLTAKQACIILTKITSRKLLTNFELCCFLTLLIDAVSCLISNVSIEFGSEYDIYKLLQTVLLTVQSPYTLNLSEIDSDNFEHLLNIIKRSENRMKHVPNAVIMKQITLAFEKNSRGNFMQFENIVQENKFFNGYNSADLTIAKSPSIKQKDISKYFMKKDNNIKHICKISVDQDATIKNTGNLEEKSVRQDEIIKNMENFKDKSIGRDEIIKNKENLKEKSVNQTELQSKQGKIFVRTDLGYINSIPPVQTKRNAFDILMKKK